MIISVMKCQKPSPDCYDMINQSHEEATERSPTVTSSKSAGRRSSTVLGNGFLKTGYQLCKGGGAKKRFQSYVNPDSSNQFLYLRAIQRHQQKVSLFLRCKTMYCYRKDLPSTSATSGTRTISIKRNGLIPGGTSLKRGRQAVFIRTVNPMEDVHGIRETPCYVRKPRITPYKNTWIRPQNTVCWCNLKLAQEKGLSILPNTVTCRLSLQYTVCSLHWESGRYENSGRSSTKRCTELRECHESCSNHLAIWSTRSAKPRNKIILGTTERFEK